MKDIVVYKFSVTLECPYTGAKRNTVVEAEDYENAHILAEKLSSWDKVVSVTKYAGCGVYRQMSEETRKRIEAENADSIPF